MQCFAMLVKYSKFAKKYKNMLVKIYKVNNRKTLQIFYCKVTNFFDS